MGDRLLAAEEADLRKTKEEVLRKEEEFYAQLVETPNMPQEERIAKYKEEQSARKKEKKTLFYMISGVSPSRATFFHPLTRTVEHQQIEEWWFGLTDAQRNTLRGLIRLTGIKKKIVTHVLDYADYEVQLDKNKEEGKPIKLRLDFYKYWFVYIALLIILIGLFVNFKLQSPLIALIGAFLCAMILFFSKTLRVRRSMGLKIFCPITIGWLKAQYISAHSNINKSDPEKENSRSNKN